MVWSLCTALPLTAIYLKTNFQLNPVCTFQDMALTGSNYEKIYLRGDNSVNIQGRIMVLIHCPSSNCHLSINQVSFQSRLYFPRYGPDRQQLWKKKLRVNNSVNIQGRIMVLIHCPSSHCHLSINQVSFQSRLYFSRYGPDRDSLWKNV